MLRLEQVSVRYRRHLAVDAVSLMANPGEVTVILGPNGSGKSSLLKAMAGVVPHQGTIHHRAGRDAPAIGYMPQDAGPAAALTVLETILLGRLRTLSLRVDQSDLDRVDEAMTLLGLADLASRHLGELSGGQRQLVFLAQVLVSDPAILLLDEPISALDIHNQVEVLSAIATMTRQRNLTTLMVLHDLNAAARHADRIVLMHGGRLRAAGVPQDVLTPANLRDVFRVEMEQVVTPSGALAILPLRVPDRS